MERGGGGALDDDAKAEPEPEAKTGVGEEEEVECACGFGKPVCSVTGAALSCGCSMVMAGRDCVLVEIDAVAIADGMGCGTALDLQFTQNKTTLCGFLLNLKLQNVVAFCMLFQ